MNDTNPAKTMKQYLFRRCISRSRGRYAGMLTGLIDGQIKDTSPITKAEGDGGHGTVVHTRSGSVYVLDGPCIFGADYRPVSFYLDTDGAETWPAGDVVPGLS
jgi:hypothetical protein